MFGMKTGYLCERKWEKRTMPLTYLSPAMVERSHTCHVKKCQRRLDPWGGKKKVNHYWKNSKCKLICWHLKKAIYSSIQNNLSEDNSKKCSVSFKITHGRKGDRMKQEQINHWFIVPFYYTLSIMIFISSLASGQGIRICK